MGLACRRESRPSFPGASPPKPTPSLECGVQWNKGPAGKFYLNPRIDVKAKSAHFYCPPRVDGA
eukprot:scaffold377437_cov16-Prasinocladus_malaysianus.AAC.1